MRNMAILVLASFTLVFTACGNRGVNEPLPSQLQPQALLGAPGSLDSSFGTGGFAIPKGDYSSSLVVQGDGKALILTGSGVRFVQLKLSYLNRLNQNGQPDLSFGSSGIIELAGDVGAMALLCPNGANAYNDWGAACEDPERAVVAVAVTTKDFPVQRLLKFYRFLPSGQPDPSFGQNGIATSPSAWFSKILSMSIQADGKILVAGYLLDDTARGYVARLKRNGTPDPTFGTGGLALLPLHQFMVKMVLPQSEYPVVLTVSDQPGVNVLRLTDAGLLDLHFGVNGVANLDFGAESRYVSALLALDNGRIVVGGPTGLGQLRPDGTPDPSFGVNGRASFPDLNVLSLALDDQNRFVAGINTLGLGDAVVARFRPNGTLDSSFGTAGLAKVPVIQGSGNFSFKQIALQHNGQILAAGDLITTVHLHIPIRVIMARLSP